MERKKLALGAAMDKKESSQMIMFEAPENFMKLSGLDPNNRWIRISELIP